MPAKQRWYPTWLEPVAWFALLGLYLSLSYFYIFQVPRLGFETNSNLEILVIGNPEFAALDLQVGDQVIQLEDRVMELAEFPTVRLHQTLQAFSEMESVTLLLERNGSRHPVEIPVAPLGWARFVTEDLFLVAIKYVYWLAGFIVITFARPRDTRWRLLIGFFLINSGWVAFGLSSRFGFVTHSLLYRAVVWLSFPIFLHLHWVFPQPLYPLSKRFVRGFYIVTLGLYAYLLGDTIASWFTSPSSYGFQELNPLQNVLRSELVYMYALVSSLLIIVWRYVRFPKQRRQLRLFNITLVSLFGFLLVWLISNYQFREVESSFGLNIFFIGQLSLPFVYLYTIYRQQIGRFSLRVNTLVSLYSFIIVLGIVLFIGLLILQRLAPNWPLTTLGLIVSIMAMVISVYGFAAWRTFFEKNVLGIPVVPSQLLAEYANRITTSRNQAELIEALQTMVLPSLLITESLLARVHDGLLGEVLYAQGVSKTLPVVSVAQLTAVSPQSPHNNTPLSWVRLALPLHLNQQTIGIWLLGHRDPDDLYDQTAVSILQSIADQTAIALTNIDQRHSLEMLYQLNIEQEENERQLMAHELHDEVLNGLAALMMQVDNEHVSPHFNEMYDKLASRLRWTIQQLRPPMLNYGIWIALSELAEGLESRLTTQQTLLFSVPQSEQRLDPQVEQHIYRIVQQALENACRHSQAELIRVHGTLGADGIDLTIEDNGVGFAFAGQLNLPQLLANKQFGLVGMIERSSLIGGNLRIQSAKNQGTTIQICWEPEI
ncbi:MAG: ATP-binding protein [Chloroflexota bacterium]